MRNLGGFYSLSSKQLPFFRSSEQSRLLFYLVYPEGRHSMTTLEAIRLLSKHGATEDQMVAVLMAAKVSIPPQGYKKVFSGPAVEFVRKVIA